MYRYIYMAIRILKFVVLNTPNIFEAVKVVIKG